LRAGALRQERLRVPVVVVGNITAGGTGKTPFVLWLVDRLLDAGFRPGIVTRGYGGRSVTTGRVDPISDPHDAGDEAVLLARRSRCPVWRGADRVAAARALLDAHPECDVLVSDDGLQHYRLARDVEIALLDGMRGTGNGLPLPSGPLREPRSRLRTCDFVVVKEPVSTDVALPPGAWRMRLAPGLATRIDAPDCTVPLTSFAGRTVHAVAGTGSPQSFFDLLEGAGIRTVRHPLPDHHVYSRRDLRFGDGLPILMTEKDAVKCAVLVPLPHEIWSVPVEGRLDAALFDSILASLHHGHRSQAA
jgi:tetraacyldisaccharide 4'-kinase